ncbi:MAG TPA: hypothetical protein PLZ51_09470, partial [Aggregatilineales bacterium]|nr:hypothetical protein [Aggregatilineales bacterium]
RQANMLIVVIDPEWLQDPAEPNLNPHDRMAVQLGLQFVCPMMLVFVDGAELPNPLPEDLTGLDKQPSSTISAMLMQSGINGLAQVVAPYVAEKTFAPILDTDALVASVAEVEEEKVLISEPEKALTTKKPMMAMTVRLVAFGISVAVIVMILIILFDSLKR